MKRIFLLIFAILILLAALTFFTYSTESLADDAPAPVQETTKSSVTPAAMGASASSTPAPEMPTPAVTPSKTAAVAAIALPATAEAAPGQQVVPAAIEPAKEEPKQISAAPVEIPKPVDTTANVTPAPSMTKTEPAAPMPTEKTSQTFHESMGIVVQTTPATQSEPTIASIAPSATPTAPAQPAVTQPVAQTSVEATGLPSCTTLCQQVCTNLQDQAAKELEEAVAPHA